MVIIEVSRNNNGRWINHRGEGTCMKCCQILVFRLTSWHIPPARERVMIVTCEGKCLTMPQSLTLKSHHLHAFSYSISSEFRALSRLSAPEPGMMQRHFDVRSFLAHVNLRLSVSPPPCLNHYVS